MRRTENGWFPALVAAAVLCAAWVGWIPAADARVALVVGNSAYRQTKPLNNPSNDAEDMAGQLRRLGFEVIEGRDLTQAGFYDHLRKFSSALRETKGEAALFFYAGHGMQDENGKNHLVPVDSPMRDEWDLPRMVRFDYVMDAMKGFSGLKLVFLDACRDNPLRGARSLAGGAKRGLAPMKRAPDSGGPEEGSGTLIMYATAPDDTAADGEGRNSPFTEALLEHVATPGLEVGEMLERVVGTVKERTRRTGKQQVPWMSASKSGRFFFVSGSGGSGSTGGSVATSKQGSTSSSSGTGGDGVKEQQIAAEREFWQSIKDSRNPAEFRAYLTRYRDGIFADLARNRLEELEGTAGEDSSATESTDGEDLALGLTLEEGELVQHALGSLGFDPGLVDGGIGPKTRRALKSWQKAKEYPVTGTLSKEQLKVLLAVGRKAQAKALHDAKAARRAEDARKAEEARRRAAADRMRRTEEARWKGVDGVIETRMRDAISADPTLKNQTRVNATSFHGVLLLTGEVPGESLRNRIIEIARVIPRVQLVQNEVALQAPVSRSAQASDAATTGEVTAALLGDGELKTVPIKVITERRVVYLMGLVTQHEAERAMDISRRVAGVQRVVNVMQYIQ